MNLPDFTKLTRKPLGVVGLFIWLIYSIAGLVMAASAQHLPYSLQLVLTLFIALFPLAILGVFYLLVTKHHEKLYAPADFKDETLFFRPATQDEVREKYELEQVTNQEKTPVLGASLPIASQALVNKYAMTEAAALKFVEVTLGHQISRDVTTEIDGRKFYLDGIYSDAKRLDIFEVKLYKRPVSIESSLNR